MSQNPVGESPSPEKAEPSLGPACLVISILGLATFSAICGIGSWIVFSNQPELAIKAIEKQLIPWVEASQLAPEDKQSIAAQLGELQVQLEAGAFDKNQLLRLRNCLQDNPVLLWGGLQAMEKQAPGTDLTETELDSLIRLNQRLLRMAVERKMGRRDLEFTLQEVSQVQGNGSHLEVRYDLNADQIRSYMNRAENLLSRSDIPHEPYEKTPAEAFALLVEAALEKNAN